MFKNAWVARPFQYSSALKFEISVASINILSKMMVNTMNPPNRPIDKKEVVVLDPCCGSGTNLYVARM